MEVEYLIRKFGKYLGGINTSKILEILTNENIKCSEIERKLLQELLGENKIINSVHTTKDNIRFLECLRIKSILEKLETEEDELTRLIIDLKLTTHTQFEISKVIKKLRFIRKRKRMLMKIFNVMNCLEILKK